MTRGLAVLFLALAACSSSSSHNDLAVTLDLSSPDLAMARTVTLGGGVVDPTMNPPHGAPIAGLSICVYPAGTPCATSGTDGIYELSGLPVGQDFGLLYKGTGFIDDVFLFNLTDDNNNFNVAMIPPATYDAWLATAGKTQDPTKGSFIITAIGPAANGATIGLTPASGDGPYYYQGVGAAAPLGTSLGGFVLYYNVDVGSPELGLTTTGPSCPPVDEWAGDAGRAKVLSIAGKLTSVVFFCP